MLLTCQIKNQSFPSPNKTLEDVYPTIYFNSLIYLVLLPINLKLWDMSILNFINNNNNDNSDNNDNNDNNNNSNSVNNDK